MKRAILGTIGGAVFGGVVAAAVLLLLFGAILLLLDSHPMDRERRLAMLPYAVTFSGVCGTIVGGLAGLASYLPVSRTPFLRCCIFIATGVGLVRLLTAPRPKITEADQYYMSYAACLFVGVVITVVVILRDVNRGRSPPAQGH